MAQYKYTMIFDYFSGITATSPVPVRIGSWSESYYTPAADPATDTSFVALMTARLGMCARGTSISKWRVQQVDPTRAAAPKKVSLAAPLTWLSDVPQMALKMVFVPGLATGSFVREFRGMPDVQVTVGEYSPTGPYTAAVQAFLGQLTNSIWRARRRDKDQVKHDILSISDLGVVVMTDPQVGVAVGNKVQVLRTVDPRTGRKFGYFAKVQAVTDDQHFTIVGPRVRASGFGQMRIAAVGYSQFNPPDPVNFQAVVRKVGRPSRSYSGKASKH